MPMDLFTAGCTPCADCGERRCRSSTGISHNTPGPWTPRPHSPGPTPGDGESTTCGSRGSGPSRWRARPRSRGPWPPARAAGRPAPPRWRWPTPPAPGRTPCRSLLPLLVQHHPVVAVVRVNLPGHLDDGQLVRISPGVPLVVVQADRVLRLDRTRHDLHPELQFGVLGVVLRDTRRLRVDLDRLDLDATVQNSPVVRQRSLV